MCTVLSVEAVRAFPKVSVDEVDQRMRLMQDVFSHFEERSAFLPDTERNAIRHILSERVLHAMFEPVIVTEQLLDRQCWEGMKSYDSYRLKADDAALHISMQKILRAYRLIVPTL